MYFFQQQCKREICQNVLAPVAAKDFFFWPPSYHKKMSVIEDCITALLDSQIEPLSSNEFLFSDKTQAQRDVGTVVNAT